MALGRTGGVSALVVLVLVFGASSASAATRHAAPRANGTGSCAPSAPCSLFTAIGGATNGDEVIVEAGEYTDAAGDLGPPAVEFIQIPIGVEVRGEAGKPRPKIVLEDAKWTGGVFMVGPQDVVAHLEIATAVATANINQFGGTIEDLIARNTSASANFACAQTFGTMRDSVCLSSAPSSAALGVSNSTASTLTATLRNVTAIDTGSDGVGLSYAIFNGGTMTVDAKSVLAMGDTTGVEARGVSTSHTPGSGGHVTIELDHSDYGPGPAETETEDGGSAAIVDTNGFSLAPLLAADGYHQLKGSPTIDAGAVDGASGSTDIDGQERTIDAQPDVGADEFAHRTTLTLACDPEAVTPTGALPGPGTSCTATVADIAGGATTPTGTVSFSFIGPGTVNSSTCSLAQPGSSPTASCAVTYTPSPVALGQNELGATYAGDGTHDGSQGATTVFVNAKPLVVCAPSASRSPTSAVFCGGLHRVSRHLKVRIGKKPVKETSGTLARFTFSSNPAGAGFECKLDTNPYKRCRSPFTRGVEPGRHRFAVRAFSNGGGTSKPAIYRWTVKATRR